jgi:hypothetical protein
LEEPTAAAADDDDDYFVLDIVYCVLVVTLNWLKKMLVRH